MPAVSVCADCDPGAGVPWGGRVKRSCWRLPSADTAPVGPSAAGIFAAASWMVLTGLPCTMLATCGISCMCCMHRSALRAGIVMAAYKSVFHCLHETCNVSV